MTRGSYRAIVYLGGWTGHKADDGQYDRCFAEMEAHHQGAAGTARTADAASKAGSTGSRWGSRPPDMEFQKTKEAGARGRSRSAFGVPPMASRHSRRMRPTPTYQEAKPRAFLPAGGAARSLNPRDAALSGLAHGVRVGEQVTLAPDLDQVALLSVRAPRR